jgi:rRNA-processing protein FCF1
MLRENVVTLTKKDGSREIVISGPWIIEMLGFEDKNEIDKVLNDIRITIMSSYDLWEEKGVVQLIDAQKEFIDADQVLKSLVSKFALQYSSTEAILRVMEADKKVVIDTSILIDERLSFLIVRATQGTLGIEYSIERPIIVIPNVVIYEIKSMLDRKSPKESQYRSGNQELLRLRALHDAGYVSVEYIGETPLLPPVAQYEKGSWRFISSLRDEYILNVLGKTSNSVLLTSDGRLATSAYARGQEVVLIKPLDMEINERLKEDLIDYKNLNEYEREKILIKICEDIMVSKDKISNLITQKVS